MGHKDGTGTYARGYKLSLDVSISQNFRLLIGMLSQKIQIEGI